LVFPQRCRTLRITGWHRPFGGSHWIPNDIRSYLLDPDHSGKIDQLVFVWIYFIQILFLTGRSYNLLQHTQTTVDQVQKRQRNEKVGGGRR